MLTLRRLMGSILLFLIILGVFIRPIRIASDEIYAQAVLDETTDKNARDMVAHSFCSPFWGPMWMLGLENNWAWEKDVDTHQREYSNFWQVVGVLAVVLGLILTVIALLAVIIGFVMAAQCILQIGDFAPRPPPEPVQEQEELSEDDVLLEKLVDLFDVVQEDETAHVLFGHYTLASYKGYNRVEDCDDVAVYAVQNLFELITGRRCEEDLTGVFIPDPDAPDDVLEAPEASTAPEPV